MCSCVVEASVSVSRGVPDEVGVVNTARRSSSGSTQNGTGQNCRAVSCVEGTSLNHILTVSAYKLYCTYIQGDILAMPMARELLLSVS